MAISLDAVLREAQRLLSPEPLGKYLIRAICLDCSPLELILHWEHAPPDGYKRLFDKLWKDVGGENVEHLIIPPLFEQKIWEFMNGHDN